MSQDSAWSRRRLVGAAIGTSGVLGRSASAKGLDPADRGIGGTGVMPDTGDGRDRGIGGTGVVGTIRRFGSIVVNGLRITFPRTVDVRIDGRSARLSDLDVGHVVHVLAQENAGRLRTRRIEAFSAVVGPVDTVEGDTITVMGQAVTILPGMTPRRLQVGQWVAVSGLRRLDGVIVASLVRRARGGAAWIAGIPTMTDGEIRIGALPLDNLPAEAVGGRMRLSGRLAGGRFLVADARPEWSNLLAARPDRLSVEDYVALDNGSVVLASGLRASESVVESRTTGEVRAVVSAVVSQTGQIHVDGVRISADAPAPRSRTEAHEPGGAVPERGVEPRGPLREPAPDHGPAGGVGFGRPGGMGGGPLGGSRSGPSGSRGGGPGGHR